MNIEQALYVIRLAETNNLPSLDLSSAGNHEKLTPKDLAELLPALLALKTLQSLKLTANRISDITVISCLISLRSLDLEANQISDITAISRLKNLRTLDLSGNRIKDISTISELKSLRNLSLGQNKISDISAISELKQLQKLYLYDNQIQEIPINIGELSNLRTLHLAHNGIAEIPKDIGELKNLQRLNLIKNPILEKKIPLEILSKFDKPQEIINYYFSVTKRQSKPLNEAKIVVIGEAKVGKTCLINKLVYDKIEETDSTHGIQIHRWENVRVNNQDLQLNVWDFGGQEIMHSTHQFFFTRRTIYILVIDARKNEDAEKTEEWLKRIQSFGGDSPVIIVGNQIDQNKRNEAQRGVGYFSINSRGLQDKFKNIRGFYGLCAYDVKVTNQKEKKEYARKFEEFRKDLIEEIGNLQGIDTPFPSDWFAVKEDLETMHEKDVHYISKSDYITKCIDRNVREQIDQTTIVEFLNEVGTVIYFEDLPDTMVFNPEWITQGVYAIVDNHFIKENKGILKRESLKTLLDPKDYPADKHDYILNMMKKFELCVDIEPNRTFLLPDLLPTSQPENIREDDWKNTLGFQYHYDTYLPNIFTRFIVKMYGYRHGDLYWRNGIILEQGQSTALVKADVVAKKIFISVKGKNKRDNQALLSIIRKELREIHGKFEVLDIAKKVPHPNYPEILKDYDELAAMEEDGETEVYVVELRRKLPISDWLDGVESAADRRRNSERKPSNAEEFIKHSPNHVSLAETEKDGAAIVDKKETLARLRNKLEVLESKKAICDNESEKAGNKTAKTFIALTTLIHIISFGVLIFLIFSYQDGWNNFEKWTFGIFVGLEILNLLFSTGFFIKTSREFSWTEFRNALAERKREKKYLSYEIDEKEIEKLKKDIEQTEKELIVK